MSRAERIAEVEAELVRQRALVDEAVARLRGLETELDVLRGMGHRGGGLAEASRADAIRAVLQQAPGTMSPKDVQQALTAAGRSDDYRSITATLDHLMKQGSVQRPGRGVYLAT